MAEILQPQPNESIYDPTCGSGGMLVKCLDYLRNKGEEWQGVQVFGQEVNGLTSSIARMNLYLNGVEDFSIACADTLENPAFIDGSQLRKFDIVLANPPYSIKEWNREKFMNDKWGRNFLGTPPQGRADYAFVGHILKSLDSNSGRCAILLPHGVLFRNEEHNIRKSLIESDLIEAVIGLGPNLFYNSPMEASIIICRTRKDIGLNNKIIFINALKEVERKNGESYLLDTHINKIVGAYKNHSNIDRFCRVVSLEELIKNNYSLNIPLYVHTSTYQDYTWDFDLLTSSKEWRDSHNRAIESIEDLLSLIQD